MHGGAGSRQLLKRKARLHNDRGKATKAARAPSAQAHKGSGAPRRHPDAAAWHAIRGALGTRERGEPAVRVLSLSGGDRASTLGARRPAKRKAQKKKSAGALHAALCGDGSTHTYQSMLRRSKELLLERCADEAHADHERWFRTERTPLEHVGTGAPELLYRTPQPGAPVTGSTDSPRRRLLCQLPARCRRQCGCSPPTLRFWPSHHREAPHAAPSQEISRDHLRPARETQLESPARVRDFGLPALCMGRQSLSSFARSLRRSDEVMRRASGAAPPRRQGRRLPPERAHR